LRQLTKALRVMKPWIVLLTLMACPLTVFADEVVFYRCTDASGALTLQNMPCPKGDTQVKKVVQSVNTVPGAAPAPVTPKPPATVDETPPADSKLFTAGLSDTQPKASTEDIARLPPPVLFQCTTYDKDSYITENEEPQSRCVPLRTVGLNGNPELGAGEACEVVKDVCARVPDGGLCEAWKKRRDETEVAYRFTRAENAEKNKAEFERADKIWRESDCGA
jgi:hypothetical protein